MKRNRLFLLAIIIPPIAEITVFEISNFFPNLFTPGQGSFPSPLGILWGLLYGYDLGILPVLVAIYATTLSLEIVLAFGLGEAVMYGLFSGGLLQPQFKLSELLWAHTNCNHDRFRPVVCRDNQSPEAADKWHPSFTW
jgi:hypothetical protein